MHEVGIAQNILEIIEAEAKQYKAKKVNYVKIIVGEFTGVVKESLKFALDIIKNDTIAQEAEFFIDTIKLKTYCNHCDKEFSDRKEFDFYCSLCKGVLKIVEGKELQIEYIDIE